jgi:O-acetyl-ADP-ribose deacetylase (regulator of RNase III)
MIVYRKGDVVEAFENGEIDILVHGCNACGIMGSGIAKQIKTKFPEAFEAYKSYESIYGLSLGSFSIHKYGKNKHIINLVTQDKYLPRSERHFSYDYFDNSMQTLSISHRSLKIGMPKIGAGLGGGDWKIIEAIINSHFKDREVFVYTLEDTEEDRRIKEHNKKLTTKIDVEF